MVLGTSRYYLRNGASWLSAPDPVKGPWTESARLPAEFNRLPKDKSWDEVKKHLPGRKAKVVPKVYVTKRPAELIVTAGPPALQMIPGTKLLCATNTDKDLFLYTNDDAEIVARLDEMRREATPFWKSTLLSSASLRLTRGRYSDAMGMVNQILAVLPDDAEAKQMRGRIEVAANSWDIWR